MAGKRPSILVVDDDGGERAAIAAVLREAGFAVVAAHNRGARAAMNCQRFAASVIALPEDDGIAFQRHARRRQPGLLALIVIEPAATRFEDAKDTILLARPFDARQLLGRIFELVLREDDDAMPHHRDTAELGIAMAKLACLDSRRSAAAADRLAHELMRQIGETRVIHAGLAAAITTSSITGGLAVIR